jgi:hypothetical protein
MNRPEEPFDAAYDDFLGARRLEVIIEQEPSASYVLTVVGQRVLARFKAHQAARERLARKERVG